MKYKFIKNFKKISPVIIALSLIILPVFAHAQTAAPAEYKLLAPIPQLTKNGGDTTDTATYIPGLVKLAIALAGAFAVLRIIYAGIIYMSTDAFTGKESAKGMITDAIFGLLLAIGAWTILYSLNPKLLDFSLDLQQVGSKTLPNGPNYSASNGGTQVNFFGGGLSQDQVYSQFTAAGITFQGAPVLAGLHQEVVNEVVGLKNNCNCDVVVNSATGGDHAIGTCSHANGWKIDLDDTTSLNNYIQSNFTNTGIHRSTDGALLWKSPTGVSYYRESTHWDVALQCQ